MNIGCLFGTFDPPHNGHIMIARWMLQHVPFDQVWLVVTPDNPFKRDKQKSDVRDRVAMTRLAVKGIANLEVSEEEADLPAPHYTVDTLAHFRKRWPEHHFSLIIGDDNLQSFDRWKEPWEILRHHEVFVYPRTLDGPVSAPSDLSSHPNVKITAAPLMTISSTAIRKALHRGEDTDDWLRPEVRDHAMERRLYTD
jgi:nicotinate-nucleotide adenylyltransferase